MTRAIIENPRLKDATLAALEVLGKSKKGFFLLVEQGDIDWANHANDYRWISGPCGISTRPSRLPLIS